MTRPFLSSVPQADATRDAIAAAIPMLETERLILRAPRLSDFEVLEPIWRSERSQYMGGPFNEEDAWLDYCQTVASWLLRGIGYWVVTDKAGLVLGLTGLSCETEDPELEFGWLYTEDAEGAGYATEAGRAVHAYIFDTLGFATVVSFVNRLNKGSEAVARKLGALEDPTVLSPELAAEDFAFRHSKGAAK